MGAASQISILASFFVNMIASTSILLNYCNVYFAQRSWLRHCATSRKIAGSIPDGVNGIFH